jgi:hypothetical protein
VSNALRTLPELVAAVTAAMTDWPAQDNGQVRAVPDERTLRWYGTLGLLDRPLSWRGRTALYGERHRLQALAIKRLQLAGWPIASIQQRLLGADDAALSAVLSAPSAPPVASETESAPRRQSAFWAAPAAASAVAQPRLHLDLGHGAELVLPPGATADAELDAALAPLRAWLARRPSSI